MEFVSRHWTHPLSGIYIKTIICKYDYKYILKNSNNQHYFNKFISIYYYKVGIGIDKNIQYGGEHGWWIILYNIFYINIIILYLKV